MINLLITYFVEMRNIIFHETKLPFVEQMWSETLTRKDDHIQTRFNACYVNVFEIKEEHTRVNL